VDCSIVPEPAAGSDDSTGSIRGPRCATWAREVALDPGGSAPRSDVFVLVEHPLPWTRDISEDPLFARISKAVEAQVGDGRSVRVQAIAGEPGAVARRVVVFSAASAPFTGYGRVEGTGSTDELPGLAAALIAEPIPEPERGVTDVLVCTHGSRDTCCGSLGTRLFAAANGRARVWRTSHTGGHRFAPTAITFPDGLYWAFLDADTLAGIVDRSSAAHVAAAHVRGCAAFPAPVQVADRAVLALHGWEWLSCARFAEQKRSGRVEFCYESPGGDHGGYDVRLSKGREMPVPDCGADPSLAGKTQIEWQVTRVNSW
jgi:hypothetical protein